MVGDLPPEEMKVARLVAEGLTTPQIAKRLSKSKNTVTKQIDTAMRRLGLHSRVQLAMWVTERFAEKIRTQPDETADDRGEHSHRRSGDTEGRSHRRSGDDPPEDPS
jgi:DNA-binding CsgD family transcriptional regulator